MLANIECIVFVKFDKMAIYVRYSHSIEIEIFIEI